MIDMILPAVRAQTEELEKYANTEALYKVLEEEILAFRQRLKNGEEHPTYLYSDSYI